MLGFFIWVLRIRETELERENGIRAKAGIGILQMEESAQQESCGDEKDRARSHFKRDQGPYPSEAPMGKSAGGLKSRPTRLQPNRKLSSMEAQHMKSRKHEKSAA